MCNVAATYTSGEGLGHLDQGGYEVYSAATIIGSGVKNRAMMYPADRVPRCPPSVSSPDMCNSPRTSPSFAS